MPENKNGTKIITTTIQTIEPTWTITAWQQKAKNGINPKFRAG